MKLVMSNISDLIILKAPQILQELILEIPIVMAVAYEKPRALGLVYVLMLFELHISGEA